MEVNHWKEKFEFSVRDRSTLEDKIEGLAKRSTQSTYNGRLSPNTESGVCVLISITCYFLVEFTCYQISAFTILDPFL